MILINFSLTLEWRLWHFAWRIDSQCGWSTGVEEGICQVACICFTYYRLEKKVEVLGVVGQPEMMEFRRRYHEALYFWALHSYRITPPCSDSVFRASLGLPSILDME